MGHVNPNKKYKGKYATTAFFSEELGMSKKNKRMRSSKKKKSASDIRSAKAYKITAKVKESSGQIIQAVRSGLIYV